MKRLSYVLTALLLAGGCAVGYQHGRYHDRVIVEPIDVWGTVTLIDPVDHRIELVYDEGGSHRSRSVYYDERATRWDGVRYTELRNGDVITVRGRDRGGRWTAESVARRQREERRDEKH
jgi:hypothetical protein